MLSRISSWAGLLCVCEACLAESPGPSLTLCLEPARSSTLPVSHFLLSSALQLCLGAEGGGGGGGRGGGALAWQLPKTTRWGSVESGLDSRNPGPLSLRSTCPVICAKLYPTGVPTCFHLLTVHTPTWTLDRPTTHTRRPTTPSCQNTIRTLQDR